MCPLWLPTARGAFSRPPITAQSSMQALSRGRITRSECLNDGKCEANIDVGFGVAMETFPPGWTEGSAYLDALLRPERFLEPDCRALASAGAFTRPAFLCEYELPPQFAPRRSCPPSSRCP